MNKFKEDKVKLEQRTEELLKEFCDKYNVFIEDIELDSFFNYVNNNTRYNVSVKIDL